MRGSGKLTLEQRFLKKVNKQDGEAGCWLWTAACAGLGYGVMRDATKRQTYAHRIAYEIYIKPIPPGFVIDHLCRNHICVNPHHLEPVTNRENLLRGEGFVGKESRVTHCPGGHEYTKENTYITPKGERDCRACWGTRDRRKAKT